MKRVLVIDDCEDFRELLGMMLDDAGYQSVLAENPDDALECCAEMDFDAVLCDLVMPIIKGEEDSNSAFIGTAAIFTLKQELPEVPVIAMSGNLSSEILRGLTFLKIAGTLAKPFGQRQLECVLSAALRQELE